MTPPDPALVDDLAATALAYADDDRDLAVRMLMEAMRWVPFRVPGGAGDNDNPAYSEGPQTA